MTILNRPEALLRREIAERVVESSSSDLKLVAPVERAMMRDMLLGRTQIAIAADHGIAQPSVSYRVRRALQRLEVLDAYPRLRAPDIRRAINESGFVPRGATPQKLTHVVHEFVSTTSQTAAAQAVGRSQGWVRHQVTKLRLHLQGLRDRSPDDGVTEPAWGSLLDALLLLETHGHFLPGSRCQTTGVDRGPTVTVLRRAAEKTLRAPVPPGWPRIVTTPEEQETVVRLLREHGPLPRPTVLRVLTAMGLDGDRIIRSTLRAKMAYHRYLNRKGTTNEMHMVLLPPTVQLARFGSITRSQAVLRFCACYDRFTTTQLCQHLSLRGHRLRQARLPAFLEILRAEGFREIVPGTWMRRRR